MLIKPRHIAAVCLILAEILALIWVFPYLPMVDLPEHMLAAQVLTHYHSAGYNYPAFFTMKIPWNPYSSYFLFVFWNGAYTGNTQRDSSISQSGICADNSCVLVLGSNGRSRT
jgi:hypothetical protein